MDDSNRIDDSGRSGRADRKDKYKEQNHSGEGAKHERAEPHREKEISESRQSSNEPTAEKEINPRRRSEIQNPLMHESY